MGAFLGLVVGVGLLLIWHGIAAHPSRPRSRVRSDRTREHLIQAGLPGVTPAQVIALQVLAATVVAVLGLALTQSVTCHRRLRSLRSLRAPHDHQPVAAQAAGGPS